MKYFLPLLGLLFIGLKLTNYIDWSWWLVTLPIWGSIALGLLCMLIALSLSIGTRFK